MVREGDPFYRLNPPVTSSRWPVSHLASSLQRNATTPPMSSGAPMRPRAVCALMKSCNCGLLRIAALAKSVSMPPGATVFARCRAIRIPWPCILRTPRQLLCVNCHIKCDWQWFWPNYVRLSFPQYLRLGEKIQETGLLVSLTGWLCSASGRGCLRN
jgi:hypothetical protein